MARNTLVLITALIFAGFVTLILYSLQDSGPDQVLVAAKSLTVGSRLEKANIDWKAWPKEHITNDFITTESAKVLRTTQWFLKTDVKPGQPITRAMLSPSDPRMSIANHLASGEHAIILNVPDEFSAGGLLKSGDTIDLLLTRPLPSTAGKKASGTFVSEILLHNVKIIGVNAAPAANAASGLPNMGPLGQVAPLAAPSSSVGATRSIMVKVSSQEAEIIALAQKVGELTFMLSSANDTDANLNHYPYTLSNEIGYQRNTEFYRLDVLRGTQQEKIEIRK